MSALLARPHAGASRVLALAALLACGALPGARSARAEDGSPTPVPAPLPPPSTRTAPAAPTNPPATSAPILADDFLARIRYLADPCFEGRNSTEPGALRAAEYVAAEMARFGLEPRGDAGSWFQGYAIPERRLGAGNALELTVGDTRTPFRVEETWNPLAISPSVEVEGPLVFAGYGVTNPKKAYDDYAGFDVRGKVVLVLRRDPPWGGAPTEHATFLAKLGAATEHGAAALLIVNGPRSLKGAPDKPMHWSAMVGGTPGSGRIPYAFLTQAAANALLAPLGRDVAALEKAIDAAEGGPKPASAEVPGARVRLKVALERTSGLNARNVVGLLRGSDPALAKEVVIVGAHHDHVGRGAYGSAGGPSAEGKIHPGADDNASGTAALLEVAEALAAQPRRPRRSVLFTSFSGEEMGLLGSVHYCEHPVLPLADTVAMVNCDMVGRYDPARKLEIGGVGTAEGLQALIERANAPYGLALAWDPSGVAPSDNTSFYRKRLPVLFFFTGIHPQYHTPDDTWDRIAAPEGAKVTSLVRDVVVEIADRDVRLVFTKPPPTKGSKAALGIQPGPGDGAGVVVAGLVDGGAADAAGLHEGDVVTALGAILVKDMRDLSRALAERKPGDKVVVKVVRDGAPLTFDVTLGGR